MTISAATGLPMQKPRKVAYREDHDLVLRAILAIGLPATDEQIHARILRAGHKISPSGSRSRRNELVDNFGYVCKRGSGVTEAGRSCSRWWFTEAGKAKAVAVRESARQLRLVA